MDNSKEYRIDDPGPEYASRRCGQPAKAFGKLIVMFSGHNSVLSKMWRIRYIVACHHLIILTIEFFCAFSANITKQDDHKAFWRQLEDKRPVVDANLLNGRQYVANESLADMDEQNRELVRSIRREVAKLAEQWHGLLERSDQWKRRLDDLVTVSVLLFITTTSLFLRPFRSLAIIQRHTMNENGFVSGRVMHSTYTDS